MNTKIKELIAQCTFTVTEYQLGIDSSYEDFDKEMFAELIVQTCALQCNHNEDMDNILDHFGVK